MEAAGANENNLPSRDAYEKSFQAQLKLGQFIENGEEGFEQNIDLAIEWYEQFFKTVDHQCRNSSYLLHKFNLKGLMNDTNIIKIILSLTMNKTCDFFERKPNYFQYAKTLTDIGTKEKIYLLSAQKGNLIELISRVIYYSHYYNRDYNYAEKLIKIIDDSNIKIDKINVARFNGIKGQLLATIKNNHELAILEFNKAEEILCKINNDEANKELMMSLINNKAGCYHMVGDIDNMSISLERAKPYVVNTQEKMYKIIYFSAESLNLSDKGEYNQALANISKLQNLLKEDPLHENVLVVTNLNQVNILYKLGDQRASEFAQEAHKKVLSRYDVKSEIVAHSTIIQTMVDETSNIDERIKKLNEIINDDNITEMRLKGYTFLYLEIFIRKRRKMILLLKII